MNDQNRETLSKPENEESAEEEEEEEEEEIGRRGWTELKSQNSERELLGARLLLRLFSVPYLRS